MREIQNENKKYVFLSPHLDDAVFSCGGIMWELIQLGNKIEVWTFFTANPPHGPLSAFAGTLHTRWNNKINPSLTRRKEDQKALTLLGCTWLHLNFPDCIYRIDPETGSPIVKTNEQLFSPDYRVEIVLLEKMVLELKSRSIDEVQLVVPLGVGGHIDHRLTRMAAERTGLSLCYFADFPYAAKGPDQVQACLPPGVEDIKVNISDKGVSAWQDAMACYTSQLNSFWSTTNEMKAAVMDYSSKPFTHILWKRTF